MGLEKLTTQLIKASLDNNLREVRSISMRIIRRIKDSEPKLAEEIAKALSEHAVGGSAQRSSGIAASPQDNENLQDLVKIENFSDMKKPIFNSSIEKQLNEFIKERSEVEKLLNVGLNPPASLLLHGPPGVGKTELAKYLAHEFEVSLITLDLSSVISSYLGKTGQNLKKVLDFAKTQPAVLLLDEFDAVAKRRDDMSDLGELKRIVNVLLKELEDWPSHTILIAATNHADLLDPAIWRRFDRDIAIPLPDYDERFKIIEIEFDSIRTEELDRTLPMISELTKGFSGADLKKLGERVKRRMILNDEDVVNAVLQEVHSFKQINSTEFNKKFAKLAYTQNGMTIRRIAELLGKSTSTIQYYLKK